MTLQSGTGSVVDITVLHFSIYQLILYAALYVSFIRFMPCTRLLYAYQLVLFLFCIYYVVHCLYIMVDK